VVYRSGSYVAGAGLGVLTPIPEGTERYLEWQGEKVAGQNAVFTADGRGVVLSAGSLWHLPLDEELRPTGPPVRLTTGQDSFPNLSKNGRRLAYNTSTSQTDIWRVPLDPETGLAAGPAVRVIDHPAADGAPSPLPDNRHFLFTSNREQDRWLYVADLDGGNVRVVSKSHFGRSHASPDGRWIATLGASTVNTPGPDGVVRDFTGTATLFLLPFDPATQETAGPPIELEGLPSSWSPDGSQLLVTSATSVRPELRILENPASADRRWLFSTFREDFARRYPRPTFALFAPDGVWIVFGASKERHRPAVFVVRRGSDDPRLLWEGSGFPAPSSDPERIYIASERGDETDGKLGFVPFDPVSGVATGDFQVIELPGIPGAPIDNDCFMTPDRRWLLCAVEEVEGDIYVADVER
jgi:Tol biopolymer transport system component